MYNLKQLNILQVGKLSQVPIPKQADITAQTGKPMDLIKIYQAIVSQSNNFTEKDADALKADALMWQYLDNQGFFKSDGIVQKTVSRSKADVNPADAPVVDPQLSKKQILELKLKSYQTALKFAKEPDKVQVLQAKIAGVQAALKYAK